MSKKWEVKMREARGLRKEGLAMLYRRVSLLVECSTDSSFLQWCGNQSKPLDPLDVLDAEVEDCGVDFITMKAVFTEYPEESSWSGGKLRVMIAEVLKKMREGKEPQVRRPSWKDRYEAVEVECERLRAENNTLAARVNELQRALSIVSGREPASLVA